ncbi:MAG: EF-hand domain-containing protein [Solimonas sp.]
MLCATGALLAACSHDRPSPMDDQIRNGFDAADADHDEQLTPAEFANLPLKDVQFEDVDTDSNGRVTLAELKSYLTWRRVQADGDRPIDGVRGRRPQQ